MDRAVLISSDCHAGPPVATYGEYLESKYQGEFRDYLSAREEARRKALSGRALFSKEGVEKYNEQELVKSGARSGLWDSDARIAALEADGTVGEVIFPDGTEDNEVPFAPFGGFAGTGGGFSAELRLAGARAHNRWLADVCSLAPDRRAGVALLPLHDIDAAVREIHWAKEVGLRGGVGLHPNDTDLPLYDDERYDPIWATCEELGMPINMHTGPGKPNYGNGRATIMLIATEGNLFWGHRALWILIWSGVFERHPNLKFVLSENRIGWLPYTLEWLDDLYENPIFNDIQQTLPRRPSEYWHSNCYVGASFFDEREAALREVVGTRAMMWGSDYPHVEGTWPVSLGKLTGALVGVPEGDARSILAGTAADLYGFDMDALAPIAARVGPKLEDLGVVADPVPAPA